MGLDMYLYKKIYIGAKWEHRVVGGDICITDKSGNRLDRGMEKLSYLEYDFAYWRKANSIHNWFVQNVQEGKDECQTSYVSKKQLKELFELAKKAADLYDKGKKEEASRLLPPASGFFFGQVEINDWYREDLQETIDQLIEEIENPDEDAEYYYHASW